MAKAFNSEEVQEVPSKDGDNDRSCAEVSDVDEHEDHACIRGWLVGALGEFCMYIFLSYILISSTLQQNSDVNG